MRRCSALTVKRMYVIYKKIIEDINFITSMPWYILGGREMWPYVNNLSIRLPPKKEQMVGVKRLELLMREREWERKVQAERVSRACRYNRTKQPIHKLPLVTFLVVFPLTYRIIGFYWISRLLILPNKI